MSSQRGSSAKMARNGPQPKQAPSSSQVGPGVARRQEREQRLRGRQREAARLAQIARLKRRGLWGGGIVAGILIIFLIVHAVTSSTPTVGNIPGVKTYPSLKQDHVTGKVTYPQNPPVGGPHAGVWLNCGIYDTPVANENAVHSMEHGAVWITYQPTLAAADVQHLVSLVKGHSYVILSPYDGLPTPVVASAWGVQLQVQTAYDSRIAQFIQKYEQGPQTPEQGASCSGGTGSPVG